MGKEVLILSAVRTPIGKMNGSLSHLTSLDLGGIVIAEALSRAGVEDRRVDEIVMGNILSTEPRGNPVREAALKVGIPSSVPAYTVNKNCGSALKALNIASAMVRHGERGIMVAGGMESVSRVPQALYGARVGLGVGHTQLRDLLLDALEGSGQTAERIAQDYHIPRDYQDAFVVRSHKLAGEARMAGFFSRQIVPVERNDNKVKTIVESDEFSHPGMTLEDLSRLKPAFLKEGTVTSGNSSLINDGASALVVADEFWAKILRTRPLARVVSWAEAGVDPAIMGIAPVPAIKTAVELAGLSLGQIDLFEINEAYASQVLAVCSVLGLDMAKVNVNGGALAFGHPVGATGAVLVSNLVFELKRRRLKYGLVSLCIHGGQGIATVLEAV